MPVQCHHCESAPCLQSCASGAIRIIEQRVIVDEFLCTGCKSCVAACPFGVIEILKAKNKPGFAGKCDLCRQREEGPACIEVCPAQALRFVDLATETKKKRLYAAEALAVVSRTSIR